MAVAPLSVSNSTIKVMNAALAELGVSPITSFSDNSIAARTGNALFADVLEACLAAYPWRFARDRREAPALPGPAPAPWSRRFSIPTSMITILSVYEDEQKIVFDRFGQSITTMTTEGFAGSIWIEGTVSVTPDLWAGYFRRAFIVQLAADMAMPITQDENLAAFHGQRAAAFMAYAKSRDAQGRTPSRIDTKMFIRNRRRFSF